MEYCSIFDSQPISYIFLLTVNQYLIYFYADMRCQIYFCSS